MSVKKTSIKTNYLYNLIYTLLNTALPLLTAPYLARVVGADGIGTYAYYYAIAHFFYIFAKLGLNNYGTRQISRFRDTDELSEHFSSIYYLQVLTATLANVIYWIYVLFFIKETGNRIYAVILGIIIFAGFFDIDWLYSGLEQFKSISRKNIVVKVTSVILVFIMVKSPDDLWKYTLLMSASMLFGYLSMWIHLKSIIHFKKVPIRSILAHFKPNLILVIPVFAITVYRQMDKVMLGYMSTMEETGYYENAEKIIYALCGFITAFGTVMMPRISNMVARGEEKESNRYIVLSMQFMMSLMFAMAFGVIAVSDNMAVVLFGKDFSLSGPLMGALAITLPFIGWANIIRSQYVIPQGKDKTYIITVVTGAIINLIANAIFIPQLGAMGAVIGTILAEGSIPFTQFILLREKIQYKTILRKIVFAPLCGAFMCLCTSLMNFLPISGVTLLVLQIIVGIFTFIIFTWAYLYEFEKSLLKWGLSKVGLSRKNNKSQ